jgi:hypothetical protein
LHLALVGRGDKLEEARLHLFVAQSLAVRAADIRLLDDGESLLESVRAAVAEIEALMPISDEDGENSDMLQGCALLGEAADLFERNRQERLPRGERRRMHALNRQGADLAARALAALGARAPLSSPRRRRRRISA